MATELAVIATRFFEDFLTGAVKELEGEIDFHFFYYNNFYDVQDIYQTIPERIRGVVISGAHPEYIIRASNPGDGRVLSAFMNDHAAVYKQFLKLFHERPGLTTERIFFDSFDLLGINLKDYLYGDSQMQWDSDINRYYGGKSLEKIIADEEFLYRKHLQLWQEGKIDISLTRFSSLVEPLLEQGIDVRFLFPGTGYFQQVCREVAAQVEIASLQAAQPAVLLATSSEISVEDSPESLQKREELKKCLLKYMKNIDAQALMVQTPMGFEIVSRRLPLAEATSNFTRCLLQTALCKKLGFQVAVGYGLGSTLPQARLNAIDANREAMRHKAGNSFLVDDTDKLVGPLEKGKPLVVSRDTSDNVLEMSSLSGLSTLTVQRILSIAADSKDGYITSQYVAERLAITQRSANRFLRALLSGGQIELVGMRRSTTKGRPERLYRLAAQPKNKK